MRKNLALFLLMFLLVTSLFCFINSARAQSDNAPASQDRKAIDEFNRRFVDNCRTMNHKGAAELWAEDGVDLLPQMEPMVGKAAISKWLLGLDNQLKGAKVTQCDVDWQTVQISGDTAYEWGINTQTVSLPDKPEPFKNRGKITLILRRQPQGEWKLALESWNSSPQK
jgi:ketosteroid isomerase-like protein